MFRYQRAVSGLVLVSYMLATGMAGILHQHDHAAASGEHVHAHTGAHECCHDHGHSHSHAEVAADQHCDVADASSTASLSACHDECSICRFLGQRVLAAHAGQDLASAPLVEHLAAQWAPLGSFDQPRSYSSRAPPQIG